MLDEPGSNYRPAASASRPKRAVLGSGAVRAVDPPGVESARPWWVHLTAMVVFTALLYRIWVSVGDSPLAIFVQLASVGALGVIFLGIYGMRRWGALLFVGYCVWQVASALALSGYNISIIRQEIENPQVRLMMIVYEGVEIVFALVVYGLLGLWNWFHLPHYTQHMSGWTLRGRISFLVILGLMFLYSATQIAYAREYIHTTADYWEQNLARSNSAGG